MQMVARAMAPSEALSRNESSGANSAEGPVRAGITANSTPSNLQTKWPFGSIPSPVRFHGGKCTGYSRSSDAPPCKVPANIVEGCARESRRDYARFLEVAFSSTREVIYLLDLASRLEMVDKLKAEESKLFAGRVAAALAALIKVNRPRPHGTPSSP